MVREVVKIDEQLCNGCGICIPGCHEGALQVIDGKARLISDLMCDGLGACIGHCPQEAISIEKREAESYNEAKVLEIMINKGKNTVIAHLKHLKDHNEIDYLREGVKYLKSRESNLPFNLQEVINDVHGYKSNGHQAEGVQQSHSGGCPGSRSMQIERGMPEIAGGMNLQTAINQDSELTHWPVQLHLINPQAPHYRNADILIAADCTAFAMGNFHSFLKGKSLAIACPKLDSEMDGYLNKITAMIDHAGINTITVMVMQVPCCSGLLRIVQQAASAAQRKVPIKMVVVSIEGKILQEQWM